MQSDDTRGTRSDGGDSRSVTDERSPNERATRSVIRAVACALDREPLHLAPLYETVDPDALDRLFDGDRRGGNGSLQLSFRYESCEVTLYADGRTVVELVAERDGADSASADRQ